MTAKQPIRFGVVGTGRWAAAMIPRLHMAPACTIAAIASRDPARAARLCHPLRLPPSAGCTFDQLLARDDIDAVYITTPNHLHALQAVRALDAGKHVLVEKPLAWNRASAERAFFAAGRNRRVLAEGFTYMHHPQTDALRRVVERGLSPEGDPVIGKLTHIAAHRNFPVRPESHDTRLSHAMHGGSLMDLGCYALSFPVAVSGYPLTDLRAAGAVAEPLDGEVLGVDSSASWTARLDGAPVTVSGSCSITAQGSQAIELVGHLGVLSTNWAWSPDEGDHVLRFHPTDGGEEQRITLDEPVDRVKAQFTAFARTVRGERAPTPSPTQSVHFADLLEQTLRQVGVRFDEPQLG